jgi:putative endonuclease
MAFHVYMLRCSDGTLYCGSTKDLVRRIREHNSSKLGARYTKARRPVELVYSEECDSWSAALKRECALKKLKRAEKLALITG